MTETGIARERPWLPQHLFGLAMLGLITFFAVSSSLNLSENDPDEGWYGSVSRTMVRSGDYVVPRYLGEEFFEKPPLYFWCQAVCLHALGENEFAVRLPSRVFGILTMLLVYVWGTYLYGSRTGLKSAVVFATTLAVVWLGRVGKIDMMLTFFMTGSIACLYAAIESPQYRKQWFLLSSVTAALAVLAKGPIGVFFPFLIGVAWLVLTRRAGFLRQLPILRGLALFSVIVAPWYVMLTYQYGERFLQTFFFVHNFGRFAYGDPNVAAATQSTVPFTAVALLVMCFPWTFFVFNAVGAELSRGRDLLIGPNFRSLFLLLAVVLPIAVLMVPKGPYVHHFLPAIPPLSILIGRYFAGGEYSATRRGRPAFVTAGILTSLVFLAGMVRLALCRETFFWTVGMSVLCGAVAVALLVMLVLRHRPMIFWTLAGGLTAILLVYSAFGAPYVQQFQVLKDVALEVNRARKPTDETVVYREHRLVQGFSQITLFPQAMAFYLEGPTRVVYDANDVREALSGEKRVFCVLLAQTLERVTSGLNFKPYELARREIISPPPAFRPPWLDTPMPDAIVLVISNRQQ